MLFKSIWLASWQLVGNPHSLLLTRSFFFTWSLTPSMNTSRFFKKKTCTDFSPNTLFPPDTQESLWNSPGGLSKTIAFTLFPSLWWKQLIAAVSYIRVVWSAASYLTSYRTLGLKTISSWNLIIVRYINLSWDLLYWYAEFQTVPEYYVLFKKIYIQVWKLDK